MWNSHFKNIFKSYKEPKVDTGGSRE